MEEERYLSNRVNNFLFAFKTAIAGLDKQYERWLAVNYPEYEVLMQQQRLRIVGMVIAAYEHVVEEKVSPESTTRLVEWVRRNPFTVVNEKLAAEMFMRLHSNVPYSESFMLISGRLTQKFVYALVNPNMLSN